MEVKPTRRRIRENEEWVRLSVSLFPPELGGVSLFALSLASLASSLAVKPLFLLPAEFVSIR
jgi:hypothetical protein